MKFYLINPEEIDKLTIRESLLFCQHMIEKTMSQIKPLLTMVINNNAEKLLVNQLNMCRDLISPSVLEDEPNVGNVKLVSILISGESQNHKLIYEMDKEVHPLNSLQILRAVIKELIRYILSLMEVVDIHENYIKMALSIQRNYEWIFDMLIQDLRRNLEQDDLNLKFLSLSIVSQTDENDVHT